MDVEMRISRDTARRETNPKRQKTETGISPCGSTWNKQERSLDGNEVGDIAPTPELPDSRFMRSPLAASDDCIKVIDLDGKLSFMSEGGQHIMEVSDFNAIKGCPWPDFWADQGNAEARFAIEEVRAGRSYRFQGAADTAAGNPGFWDVQVDNRDLPSWSAFRRVSNVRKWRVAERRHSSILNESFSNRNGRRSSPAVLFD